MHVAEVVEVAVDLLAARCKQEDDDGEKTVNNTGEKRDVKSGSREHGKEPKERRQCNDVRN